MTKLRVSHHSGRSGSAAHNDRSFLRGKDEQDRREIAPHIREDSERKNRYLSIKGEGTFRDREMAFYRKRYAAAQEATNARYRREGHPERCRSVDDLYADAKTRPEELIIQIGNRQDEVDPAKFESAVEDYVHRLEDWSRAHGDHMRILNVACHYDETSPHAHIRRVWEYEDREGLLRLGQTKALKAAGIGLPHPDKPEGRYNNVKISFDQMARGLWQEVARDRGFEIETEPRSGVRHLDKAAYIDQQIADQEQEVERNARQIALQNARIRAQSDEIAAGEESIARLEKSLTEASERLESIERVCEQAAREELPPVKRKLNGREVMEIDPDVYIKLRDGVGQVREAQQVLARQDRILENARQEADAITRRANADYLDQIDEIHADKQDLARIRKDHPELFNDKGRYKRNRDLEQERDIHKSR